MVISTVAFISITVFPFSGDSCFIKTWLAVKGISVKREYLRGFPSSLESMPLGQRHTPTVYTTCLMWNNQVGELGGRIFFFRGSPRNGRASLQFECMWVLPEEGGRVWLKMPTQPWSDISLLEFKEASFRLCSLLALPAGILIQIRPQSEGSTHQSVRQACKRGL